MGGLVDFVKRADGWANLLTGLGVKGKDKRLGAEVSWSRMDEDTSETVYAGDDLAAKIVDHLPNEGTREWVEFKQMDAELIKGIQEKQDKLQLIKKIRLAWKWARLYGGAGIFIDARDGGLDLMQPINVEKIKTIASLTVLNRWELEPRDIDSDIKSKNYGKPKSYALQSRFGAAANTTVHYSRIIRFDGVELPRNLYIRNNYWGDSVLNRVYNALRNFNITNDSIAGIVSDFRVNLLKMKNLADLIAAGKEDMVKKRIEIMNLSRSVLNTLLIGDEEDFQQLTTSVSGISELVKIAFDRLQAASGLPHTILFGEGSEGNTSGRSELRDFYDFVANQQEEILTDHLNYLFELIFRSQDGPTAGKIPEEWGWEFKPLWQMPASEEATLRKTVAETDQIYIQNGVLDASEIAISRFGGDTFSMETKIDLKERERLEKE